MLYNISKKLKKSIYNYNEDTHIITWSPKAEKDYKAINNKLKDNFSKLIDAIITKDLSIVKKFGLHKIGNYFEAPKSCCRLRIHRPSSKV